MKMNKDDKALWLTALRTGIFPQDRWALKTRKGCCALGVLAMAKGVPFKFESIEGVDTFTFFFPDDEKNGVNGGRTAGLPDEWCGINRGMQKEIAWRNDSGWTFKELAEYIEKQL